MMSIEQYSNSADVSVLLVEDDPDALEELADIADIEGWTANSTNSIDEALSIIEKDPKIGIVVSDVHFVDPLGESANGFQLVSRVQAKMPERDISFIMLSGDPSAVKSSVQMGAVDFLTKPLVSEDLVSAVREAKLSNCRERSLSDLLEVIKNKMRERDYASGLIDDPDAERKDKDIRQAQAELIQTALQSGYIQPWFQPVVSLETGRLCGFSTFPRWQEDGGARLELDEFVSLSRESGTLGELERAVNVVALQSLLEFERSGVTDAELTLACMDDAGNIFETEEFFQKECEKAGLSIRRVGFEFSGYRAGSFLTGHDGNRAWEDRPKRNLKIDLGDFRSGVSAALSQLEFIPDRVTLELPRGRDLTQELELQALVRVLIAMSKLQRVEVLASGIKSDAEMEFLKAEGCDFAQGPFIADPMRKDQALSWALSDIANKSGRNAS